MTELCNVAKEKIQGLIVTPGFLQDRLPGFKSVRNQFISFLKNQPNLDDLSKVFLRQVRQEYRVLIVIRIPVRIVQTVYGHIVSSFRSVNLVKDEADDLIGSHVNVDAMLRERNANSDRDVDWLFMFRPACSFLLESLQV